MQVNIAPSEAVTSLMIFLVLEDTDMQHFVDNMVTQLDQIQLKESTRVYVLNDRVKEPVDPADQYTQFQLTLHQVVSAPENKITLGAVTLTDMDPTEAYNWLDAVRQICSLHKAATFSTLILWSHAAGLAVERSRGDKIFIERGKFSVIRNLSFVNSPAVINNFSCAPVKAFKNALLVNHVIDEAGCQGRDFLFISEIANGLESLSRKPVFDLIVMANCHTQMIDNCYNLSRIASYYLAPVTLIPLDGYDFPEFIREVNKGTYTSNNCIDAGKLLIAGHVRKQPDLEESSVIFLNDLTQAQSLKELLNNVCVYFRENYLTVYPVINDLLNNGPLVFLDSKFVDLVALLTAIKNKLASPDFEKVYNPLVNALVQQAKAGHVGAQNNGGAFHSCTVYLPQSSRHDIKDLFCCQYFSGFANSRFLHETLWDDFVLSFVKWRTQQS